MSVGKPASVVAYEAAVASTTVALADTALRVALILRDIHTPWAPIDLPVLLDPPTDLISPVHAFAPAGSNSALRYSAAFSLPQA